MSVRTFYKNYEGDKIIKWDIFLEEYQDFFGHFLVCYTVIYIPITRILVQ